MSPEVMVSAGARDRRVAVQQLAESTGGTGFPIETWTTLCTAWAYREDASAHERFSADKVSAAADTRWVVDYRPAIDPDLVAVPKKRRLLYLGRSHDITSAVVIGRKDGVEFMTLAKVDAP